MVRPDRLPTLSIRQPWVTAIFQGVIFRDRVHCKRVENRTWHPPKAMIGERIRIHASKKIDSDGWQALKDEWQDLYGCRPEFAPGVYHTLGTIVGEVTLSGIIAPGQHPSYSSASYSEILKADQPKWVYGPVGWLLSDAELYERPYVCKGRQGFFYTRLSELKRLSFDP